MAERVLSTRQLNRALLARQLLLERSPLPLVRAVEWVGGLQTQYAPSPYVSLWSRLRSFRREELTRALEQRRVVQATLMRATIHVLSARDFRLFAAGTRRNRREWWLRVHRKELDGLDMDAVAARLREALEGGPRRADDLKKFLRAEGFPPAAWSGAGLWLDMVRGPPSGTWDHRRADLYGLADDWLRLSSATEAEGVAHLIRRYLGGTRAPVRFLPTWEPSLLVHARRSQILPEPYRPVVFATETPHSISTFLVDGAVAGSWSYEGGRVRLEPFDTLSRAARRELESEAEGLAAFHAE